MGGKGSGQHKGRHSAEVRARMSEAAKASWASGERKPRAPFTEEHKRKLSEATKRAGADPALCKKRGGAIALAWADPEKRARWLEGLRRRAPRTEESRRRTGEAAKRAWARRGRNAAKSGAGAQS